MGTLPRISTLRRMIALLGDRVTVPAAHCGGRDGHGCQGLRAEWSASVREGLALAITLPEATARLGASETKCRRELRVPEENVFCDSLGESSQQGLPIHGSFPCACSPVDRPQGGRRVGNKPSHRRDEGWLVTSRDVPMALFGPTPSM